MPTGQRGLMKISRGWVIYSFAGATGDTLLRPIYRVVSLKFVEEQKQILRLTTPELKDVRGPVRSATVWFVKLVRFGAMEKTARGRLGKRWSCFPLSHNPGCGDAMCF
jgi:hypothetical protein